MLYFKWALGETIKRPRNGDRFLKQPHTETKISEAGLVDTIFNLFDESGWNDLQSV